MKIALLGDTHFGGRGDSITFQEYFKKFFDTVFFPYLIDNDIKVVIQAGDLFDRRKYINFNSLNLAKKMFFNRFEELGIQLYTFPGNHDTYFKNTSEINALKELVDSIPNVNVCYDATTVNFDGVDIDFIPWINDGNADETMKFINESSSDFCVGHFEIDGFEVLKGVPGHGGLSTSIFGSYHTVFSGHYHHESKRGNIHYIGTPYEMTWSDYNDPKGFHVLDTETKKSIKITNPYNMFNRIVFDSVDDSFNFESYRETIIKVVVSDRNEKFEHFIDKLYEVDPIDLSIVDNTNLSEENVDVSGLDTEDTITIILKNVDLISNDSIEKNKMKILIQEIYNEAIELGREA